MKWYVARMDYIEAEFDTLREARTYCTLMDARKHPTFKKDGERFFEYVASLEQKMETDCTTRYIASRQGLINHGFTKQLEEWKSVQSEMSSA